mmetsp:Transcript_15459/g.25755  ORF Transcript_15459/g.25755 Transcript_15459/m.25755 type:complete len:244 (-) Transcript_15459:871-1602(-)
MYAFSANILNTFLRSRTFSISSLALASSGIGSFFCLACIFKPSICSCTSSGVMTIFSFSATSRNTIPSLTIFSTFFRDSSLYFSYFSGVIISCSCSSVEPCSLKSASICWNRLCVFSSTRDSGSCFTSATSSNADASASLRAFSVLLLASPSTAFCTSSSSSTSVIPSRMLPASSSFHSGRVFTLMSRISTSNTASLPDKAAPGPEGRGGKVTSTFFTSPFCPPTIDSTIPGMNLPSSRKIST